MIRIRAFRAIDDFDSCKLFAEEHSNVLKSYGIDQVTSSKNDWFLNPGVIVIVVESLKENVMLGGTRIHIANGIQPLPIETALNKIDNRINPLINFYAQNGTGELCGLWNSRAASGKGYSVLLTEAAIAEVGIAVAQQLNLNSLFVLCAPWTVAMTQKNGFVIVDSVGNNGTFPYPKPDLLATLLIIKDTKSLETAQELERKRIFDLRENPSQFKIEQGPKGPIKIQYDLEVKSINKKQVSEFK